MQTGLKISRIKKYVKWSSSKYNPVKKNEFCDMAFYAILNGGKPIDVSAGLCQKGDYYNGKEIIAIERGSNTDTIYVKDTFVVENGSYTTSSHMTGYDYLVNPMEQYIAKGYFDGEDFIETDRKYFKRGF